MIPYNWLRQTPEMGMQPQAPANPGSFGPPMAFSPPPYQAQPSPFIGGNIPGGIPGLPHMPVPMPGGSVGPGQRGFQGQGPTPVSTQPVFPGGPRNQGIHPAIMQAMLAQGGGGQQGGTEYPPIAINSGPSYDPFQNPGMGGIPGYQPPSMTIRGNDPLGHFNYGGSGLPGYLSPLGTQFTLGPGGNWMDSGGYPRATAVNPSDDPYGLSGGPMVGPQPNPGDSAGPGAASWLGMMGVSAKNI